ncbi:MAG: hypothetical protein KKB31_01950 [Nanoarchaeota archaeon]|nr:hypothetical protein [Nanoarchaeota archaeon]
MKKITAKNIEERLFLQPVNLLFCLTEEFKGPLLKLCKQSGITQSMMTRYTMELIEEKLIEKEGFIGRQGMQIKLTPKGMLLKLHLSNIKQILNEVRL